jgi:wobble nucleotide-excising tRNase
LIEKNNLIEKEYINLKYEHNKEIKNLKKTLKEQVEAEIKKCVEDFTNRINGECLWEGLKVKIEKFVSNIERISEIFLQRSRKYQNHEHHTKPTNALSKLNNIK